MVHIFERPLLPGWIYPCTPADIERQLSYVPAADLNGLWAVGLVPSTRKDCWANGRYFSRPKEVIHLYSYPNTLCYRQPAHTTRADIERGLAVELSYGMQMEPAGRRWVCRWAAEDLRRFTLEHVLMHEISHHVYWMQRRREGPTTNLRKGVKEQFAEDYALRFARSNAPHLH